MALAVDWQRDDYSRVPYWLYHDEELYAQEMERIFRGPVWNYLCLEAEIPQPGDFRTTWVGDTPVVVSRAKDGTIHAFVNRCAHRGAMIVRKTHGNAPDHVCIYHRWCYSGDGTLVGIPFRKGLKGEGGMPADFDMKAASPRKLRIANCCGVIFGTFAETCETVEDYLGAFGMGMVKRFFHKPIKILGYSRQLIAGNWKLYAENLRDTYHASLLHEFFVTYGVDRATQKGGVKMDARHRHNMNHAYTATDTQEEARAAYAGQQGVALDRMQLKDSKLLQHVPEFADRMNLAAPAFFPNGLLIQINHSLGTRQIRPKGVGAHEVFQTLFGYADDTPEMTRHRLISANLVGPAGLVSMEDGEAIEIVQKATKREGAAATVIEMGGRGPVKDLAHRVTETPIRGFWSYWAELMGVEAPGGIR
ncbi:MAG: Rieske 2Fe-2S domain-containing protein [Alphaproteobacteria bacterium]|nr:Rieske 2Fe-2S domain-containing protein [Alphaproteobacteria bacterium]